MARKGILSSSGSDSAATTPRRQRAEGSAPRGAVGALQSSLTKLQENAIQDLSPEQIHDAGVVDRLGVDDTADTTLRDSLKAYGQQVPVLVRPRDGEAGQYDIVYGRRRLRALRALGMPVKAMVRQLDDRALVLAQGQENTARQDLTFIEKASFAAQLDAQGYDRTTIAAALSIDLPMVSRMLRAGRAFDLAFLREIGSAPAIGRDRWLALADAMDKPQMRKRVMDRLPALATLPDSDTRFEQVLAWATDAPTPTKAKAPAPRPRKITSPHGAPLATVRRTDKGLSLNIPSRDAPDFADWMDGQAENVLHELYARWVSERSEDQDQ